MKIPQSIQERWLSLTPSDDFVFSKMMRNKAICKGLVETLLGFDIDRIEYPEEQKSIDIAMDAKSVRLDVYVKDDKDTVYNIEMQTSPQSYLPKRSRYYQGMIDLNLIEKGELYDKLNTSYVIFICTFDPFNKGRHVYHFENRCIDDPALALGDETHKCFFNTRGTDTIDPKLDQVLTFLDTAMPVNDDNPLVEAMSSELARIKSNTEWEVEFMNLYLRDKEKYREGMLAERELANRELQAERELANQKLQAERKLANQKLQSERELAKKQTLKTARGLIGFLSPDIIVSKFDITMEELMKNQPGDDGPKA